MQAVEGVLRLVHRQDVDLRCPRNRPRSTRPIAPWANTATGLSAASATMSSSAGLRRVRRHDVVLTVGRAVAPFVLEPRRHLARKARLDLRAVQPIPVAPAHFAQAMVVAGVVMDQPSRLGSKRKRLAHAAERARAHDDGWRFVSGTRQLLAERHAHRARLSAAGRRQRRVEMALRAASRHSRRSRHAGRGRSDGCTPLSARPRGSSAWSILALVVDRVPVGSDQSLARSPTGAILPSSGMVTSTLVLTGPLPMSLAMHGLDPGSRSAS